MENKNNGTLTINKNNYDSPKKNKKNINFKDSKIKNKLIKLFVTQGVSDIISVNRWWEKENDNEDSTKRWDSLEHNGVIFAPKYIPHGVKILYKGEPITLNSYQEEISTYWAGILDNDLSTKDICKKNFFKEFKGVMGSNYESAIFQDFDFSPIHKHLIEQKEISKNKSPEEKKVIYL